MKALTPYLMFNGNCREAMEFYQRCFGGKLEMMRFADAPEEACSSHTKPLSETKDQIMHAMLTSGDLMLMASDNPMGTPVVGDNISISIHPQSIPETDKLFASLSEGGKVTMPLANTFWGAYFGMLVNMALLKNEWVCGIRKPSKHTEIYYGRSIQGCAGAWRAVVY